MNTIIRRLQRALFCLVAGLILSDARPAAAIPAFSRKYQTSCQTCHVIFPKLNAHGEAFRLNGYRMPAEMEEEVKQAPVSLGSEAYERIWPEMVYPSDIPGSIPLALNTKFANVYESSFVDEGRTIIHNDFQFPQEVNLFAGGTLGKTFSFFGELTWAERPDGGSDVEIEHARIHVNSPFGPEHLVNFKIGKFAPDLEDGFQEMWLMTDNGIESLFAFNPIGFRGGSGLAEEDAPAGISLPDLVKGIEMYGVAGHRLFYTLGVTNGIGGAGDTFDGNSSKDVYARVDYKIGGMGLDGDTTGVTLPPENWRETSLRIGALGYLGNGSGIDFDVTDDAGAPFKMQDRHSQRVGLFASWYFGDLNLFGVALHGRDKLRLFDAETSATLSDTTRTYDVWFAQADYVIRPPFQVSLRYENLRPADPEARTLKTVNANFSFLIRANIKAMLEYRRDLRESKNYSLNTLLRFAY
ncbi:MAG TPA: hypothetical protein VF958_03890 [Thermoanaerobaculia bacterium]